MGQDQGWQLVSIHKKQLTGADVFKHEAYLSYVE